MNKFKCPHCGDDNEGYGLYSICVYDVVTKYKPNGEELEYEILDESSTIRINNYGSHYRCLSCDKEIDDKIIKKFEEVINE
jgi:DNA-directed RNA polymerase subunit RPC12/RpoP